MSVTKRNGNWFIRFTYEGKQYSESMGKGATKEAAKEREVEMVHEIKAIKSGFVPGKTIDEALDRWYVEHVCNKRNKNGSKGLNKPKGYLSHIDRAKRFTAGKPISDIANVAQAMLETLEDLDYAAATIRQTYNPMKQAAKMAYQYWKWLETPVHDQFPRVEGLTEREEFLTVEQIDDLANATGEDLARDMIYFMAYTGIRTAEMKRLTESSLKKGNTLLIDGKGYRKRAIPLHEEQIKFVKQHIPLICGEKYLRYHFNRARIAVDLAHIRPHDLRHTYGTMLAENNIPLRTIMQLMGHKTVKQAEIYTRLSVGHLFGAIPKQKPRPDPETPATIRPALRVVGQ